MRTIAQQHYNNDSYDNDLNDNNNDNGQDEGDCNKKTVMANPLLSIWTLKSYTSSRVTATGV